MSPQQGLLAICFQEAITAIVRLRAGREAVTDAVQFRARMRDALQLAAVEARDKGGYTASDIRSATFAVVAFLDESVLNSGITTLADWARKPLQEELFGTHIAGDVFFENLGQVLARPDSPMLPDVLEVYSLCLLLGFAGRYTGGRRGDLAAIILSLRERIRRSRPRPANLSPSWMPEAPSSPARRDSWIRNLMVIAAVLACLAVLLFFLYRFTLESGVMQAREMALEVRR
jgi:type VI secretion system protein ImpK